MSQEAALLLGLKNAIREEVRKEVLEDELGALNNRVIELTTTLQNGLGQIGQVLTKVPSTEDIVAYLSTAPSVAGAVPVAPVPGNEEEEEEEEGTYLSEGEIAVDEEIYNNVLDFICIHSMLQKCFIDRRPIHSGVRAQYTGDSDPQITISMRTGAEELGVDHHMRTVWLTLKTDADEAYIQGEYWERFNDALATNSIQMAPDQITRIVQSTLAFARKATGKTASAA